MPPFPPMRNFGFAGGKTCGVGLAAWCLSYRLLPFIYSVSNLLHIVQSLFACTLQLYIIYSIPKCRFARTFFLFFLPLIFNELSIIFTFLLFFLLNHLHI